MREWIIWNLKYHPLQVREKRHLNTDTAQNMQKGPSPETEIKTERRMEIPGIHHVFPFHIQVDHRGNSRAEGKKSPGS